MLSNNDRKYPQDMLSKRSKIQIYVQYAIFYVINKGKNKNKYNCICLICIKKLEKDSGEFSGAVVLEG